MNLLPIFHNMFIKCFWFFHESYEYPQLKHIVSMENSCFFKTQKQDKMDKNLALSYICWNQIDISFFFLHKSRQQINAQKNTFLCFLISSSDIPDSLDKERLQNILTDKKSAQIWSTWKPKSPWYLLRTFLLKLFDFTFFSKSVYKLQVFFHEVK